MICYSTQPQEGFLSRQGIAKMKSAMAREIFKEDLLPIYAEKTVRRTHTKQESKQAMHTLLTAMSQGVVRNEKIEQLITHLAQRLQHIHGKKQYGYLHANLKNIVDEIVDELGREDSVAKAYQLWWEMQASVELTYTSTPSERLPLSKCAEFKSIKNMVIQEAMHITQGDMCFEETTKEDNQLPTPTVEEVGQDAFYEGKRYITGDGVMRDIEKGLGLLMAAAEQENHYAEYALGVLYLKDEEVPRDIEKAMDYLQRAAEHGSDLAQYRLGKLYLSDDDVPYDAGKAFGYFIKAAAHGNANAQYTLGKMYQAGTHVEQDTAQAEQWFRASAKQGNQYAQFFVDNKPVGANPSVFTATTRLLHHASRVFAQRVPLQKPIGFHIDRKRRLKLSQMKQNRGHKPDDHAMELSL